MKNKLGIMSIAAACAAAITIAYSQVDGEGVKPPAEKATTYEYKVFRIEGDEDGERMLNALSLQGWRLTKVAVEDGSALITVFMERPR